MKPGLFLCVIYLLDFISDALIIVRNRVAIGV